MSADVITEVSGQDARNAVMDLLGQSAGEISKINQSFVDRTISLSKVSPEVQKIIGSIPGQYPAQPVNQVHQQVREQPIAAPAPAPVISPAPAQPDNQLMLDFTYSIAQDIVDRLDRIEKRLKKIEEKLAEPTPKYSPPPLKKT